MKSFPVLRNFTLTALAACCAIGASSARAQTYTIIDLGIIPGQKEDSISTPAAINDQAQVAGTSGASAFRYTGTKTPMEDLSINSPNNSSRAFGINSSGQVVGDSTFGEDLNSHAAIFSNGSVKDLGTLRKAGPVSRANGINASGQVVGVSGERANLGYGRAFLVDTSNSDLNPNEMIDLGTLGGESAQAWGINDFGFVTGNSQVESNFGPTHAFIWDVRSGMLDLGTLGGDFSYGTSINKLNHVAGYGTINNVDDRVHAFLHDGEQMFDLGSLGGASMDTDRSFALGVNAHDEVVGYSYLPSGQRSGLINVPLGPWSVAFVYRQGLMVNLNDLIGEAAASYRLDSATAINDKGQIVAIAYVTSAEAFHAVLLTPNPQVGSDKLESAGSAKR